MSSKSRSGYTPAQIHQYYDRISLPQEYRHEPGHVSTKIASQTSTGLEFLSALQRYNLANIPFENLDLHYSTHHSISIDSQEIFDKIVGGGRKKGRGGYCMVNNALFANVLRGLGFHVTSHGARISSSVSAAKDIPLDQVTFSGFSHMVNLVSFL
ncbi:putative N-acetyltransferase family protein, partial [Aureobasidium melanogenum]